MKRNITKMALLLAFASVAITSCSLQYRERGMYSRHNRPGNTHGNYNYGHRPEMYQYR